MGVLPPSQFALTTATFSASGANSQDPVPPQPQTDNSAASATLQTITADTTGQSLRPLWRNGEKTFPYKVYDMLEFAETSGNTDICSWLPSGESFVIHDRKLFTEFILPRFFLHKKWRSFTRQLNIWCFRRDFNVTVSDAYCHPFFKRGEVAKIACVERAESKNMFKKDPITNKRKPPKIGGASLMSNCDGGARPAFTKKGSEGSAASNTADLTTKKRRVTSSTEEEDVMDVASFLAGLKSSPKNPQKTSVTTSAPVSASVDEKSANVVGTLNSNGEGNQAMAGTSTINMPPHHQSHNIPPPYLDHQGSSTSSMAARPSTFSIPPNTAVPNMSSVNGNIMSMNNQTSFCGIGSFDGTTFDRESLSHLSTDQLVALASQMKLREQMLRERAMSLHPAMAQTMAPMGGWSDGYNEMLLQQQSFAAGAGGGAPSHGMSTLGMMPSIMGSKPNYGDVGEQLQPATTGIPHIAQNLGGYPRAA